MLPKGVFTLAGLVAPTPASNPGINPSAPVNGSNVGFSNQGNWTYVPSTAQKPATGNPQTTGGNPTGTSASNGFQPSQNTSNLYNAFMGANGGVSSAQQGQIQNAASQFAQGLYNKSLGNYNAAVQHAQSNQQYSNAQSKTAYESAQNDLNNSSMMSFLKGQQGLANRGVAGTGGAADDLNVRTGINYQNNLKGLLSNYQNALNAAQQSYGDAQFSAQQALNNADPTEKAQQLYTQLMSQAQDTQSRQAANLGSVYGTSLTNDRNAYDQQLQNQYQMASLQEKAQEAMLPYQFQTANNSANLQEKQMSDLLPYKFQTANNAATNQLDAMKAMLPYQYQTMDNAANIQGQNDRAMLPYQYQTMNNQADNSTKMGIANMQNALGWANHDETVQRDISTANYQVGMLQNSGLQKQASGLEQMMQTASTQVNSAANALANSPGDANLQARYQAAMDSYNKSKSGLDTLLKLGGQPGINAEGGVGSGYYNPKPMTP